MCAMQLLFFAVRAAGVNTPWLQMSYDREKRNGEEKQNNTIAVG